MTTTTTQGPDSTTSTPAPRRSTDAPRTTRRAWLVVTVREITVKLTDRSFLISTFFTLALIAGSVAISAFLAGRTSEDVVAVVDPQANEAVVLAAQGGDGDGIVTSELSDAAAAREAVVDGDADAALLHEDGEWLFVQHEAISAGLLSSVEDAVRDVVIADNAEAAGTSLAELAEGAAMRTDLIEPDNGRGAVAAVVGFVFAFLFYMAALLFGMTIANSVLEEKQNRIVEILATAIPIRQLMYGKVIGNTLLAFGQILLYGVVGLIAVNLAGLATDIGWLVSSSGWFVAFFVVGFTALAAVWATLGALASRSEDLQSNTGPIITVIMVALIVGLVAEGVWLAAASFVPIVSAVAMPVRLLGEDVALWQPLLSLGLNVVAAWLLLRLGERVYQRAVMQSGAALTWRAALRIEA